MFFDLVNKKNQQPNSKNISTTKVFEECFPFEWPSFKTHPNLYRLLGFAEYVWASRNDDLVLIFVKQNISIANLNVVMMIGVADLRIRRLHRQARIAGHFR